MPLYSGVWMRVLEKADAQREKREVDMQREAEWELRSSMTCQFPFLVLSESSSHFSPWIPRDTHLHAYNQLPYFAPQRLVGKTFIATNSNAQAVELYFPVAQLNFEPSFHLLAEKHSGSSR